MEVEGRQVVADKVVHCQTDLVVVKVFKMPTYSCLKCKQEELNFGNQTASVDHPLTFFTPEGKCLK